MKLKKFFLALIFVAAFSLPAAATDFIIVSGAVSSDLWYSEIVSDDTASDDISGEETSPDIVYKLNPAPYRFATIKDALEFADSPADYLGLELTDAEDSFSNVSMKIQTADSASSSIFGGEIRMGNYSNISTLDISPSRNDPMTLYTPDSASRHFTFDSSVTVTLTNFVLEGSSGTGGLLIDNGTVTLDTVVFQNMNLSSANGGAVSVTGGTATFTDCSFTGNTANNGGAVSVTGGSVSFSSGTTFSNNKAGTNGGAILLNASGVTLEIEEITFDSNDAQNGGAIALGTSGGSLSVTDSTFTNNAASINGGAIYIQRGNNFTFTGSASKNSFTGNSAESDGGAIYIAGGSSLTFSGGNEFDDNTAGANGGAIAYSASMSSVPEFAEITFNNNHAVNGGAVAILAGNVNFSGSTVFSQHNSITNGGAIYIDTTGTVNIQSEVTFSQNDADNGGIIYATGGTVNLYGDLTGGISSADGGFLYANGSNLTVNVYGSIRNNSATGNGGAIYIGSGTVNISNSSGDAVIEYNTADCGGAVYLADSNRARLNITGDNIVTFSNNTATTGGGAIYAGKDSRITFSAEILFNSNRVSEGNGGAIWLGASTQLASMTGTVTFNENQAERTDETDFTIGNGGAICIGSTGSSSVTLTSAHAYTFTNNEAYAYGGVLYTVSSDVIFDNFTISTKNTARVGGGFASSATGRITLRNETSVSNQSAPDGGAIYASEVALNNAKMFSNTATTGSGGAIYATSIVLIESSDLTNNASEGTEQGVGGGAVYVIGDLTVTDAYFYGNTAQRNGAAIFANNDPGSNTTARIENSYFDYNRILLDGNGGAVNLQNNQTSTITGDTFTNNESRRDGGALCAQGKFLNISNCYFQGNVSARWGGAVFFSQSNSNDPEASFSMLDSMFTENKGTGGTQEGGGGAVYVSTNTVSVKKCTFNENFLMAANSGGDYGGALYIDTTINPTGSDNDVIENCTFVGNYIDGGSEGKSGGGAVAIRCEIAYITSCTMTSNAADYNGSAIYVKDGKVTIAGTIAVGNTNVGAYDIWVDSTILSGGYNRIGIYGQGGGITDFYSVTGNTTDRTSYPHNTWMTLRSSYFSTNELDVNERTDLGSNIPPYIGSTRYPSGQLRILTLMLSEDASLPIEDRATNAIPYSRRQSFPAVDERGVNRRNPNIGIDIGAVFFDGTRPESGTDDNQGYSIAYVQISGVPNSIRRIGQTASLIAKIYYTNGRTAYGGTGTNNEAVTWSATPAGYLKVGSDTGIITAMRLTTQDSFVTIKVQTDRTDLYGNPATATAKVRIVPDLEFGDLNNAPGTGYTDVNEIVRSLRTDFVEYNMGYQLTDKNPELVQNDSFQTIYEAIWGTSASVATVTYDDFSVSAVGDNVLGYAIDVAADEGAMTNTMIYPCKFSGDELKNILGESNYSAVAVNLAAAQAYNHNVDKVTAAEIFKTLRIDFQGNETLIPVMGPDSSVSVADAIDNDALVVSPNDDGKGISIELNAKIANVGVNSNVAGAALAFEGGAQIIEGVLIVPDGTGDSKISGVMTFPQKKLTAQTSSETTSTPTETTENVQQTSENTANTTTTGANSSSGGSSGGGCNTGMNVLMLLAVCISGFLKRK